MTTLMKGREYTILSIKNSTEILNKLKANGFKFPFLESDVPRRPSYGVSISQFIRFARASSHVNYFNNHNKFFTAKLLQQFLQHGISNAELY